MSAHDATRNGVEHQVFVHCGNSSPDCSRTMYSAYQSGQFASRCPVRASCFPCAASARLSARRCRWSHHYCSLHPSELPFLSTPSVYCGHVLSQTSGNRRFLSLSEELSKPPVERRRLTLRGRSENGDPRKSSQGRWRALKPGAPTACCRRHTADAVCVATIPAGSSVPFRKRSRERG
jgi:hypothetical protein